MGCNEFFQTPKSKVCGVISLFISRSNNFDRVTDKYIKKLFLSQPPKSSDAFYVDNSGEMYLIEFKSGIMDKKEKSGVRLKICDSLLVLTDILDKSISYTRQNLCFILVYDETKNPRYKIVKRYSRKTKTGEDFDFPLFGFGRFKKLYFKNVFTVTKDEFENHFVKKWESAVN